MSLLFYGGDIHMDGSELVIFASTFFISSISLLLLVKIAGFIGLVDKPNQRKRHLGDIPLVGGVALYLTLCFVCFFEQNLIPNQGTYLQCISVIFVLGVLDDKFDIKASVRLLVLVCLSLWLMYTKNIGFISLGNLFFGEDIRLGTSSWWFTSIALIAGITAFNMIDGLDGLLGILSSITLLALSFLCFLQGEKNIGLFCLVLITALVPYLVCNLSALFKCRKKVFMGDSGSILIGFSLIWILLHISQPLESNFNKTIINPVNALWLIAMPLMDMAMVILRRCKKGCSPFKADRLHLHHICIRLGLSANKTLLLLSFFSMLFAGIGIWAQIYQVQDGYILLAFLLLFSAYLFGMNCLSSFLPYLLQQIRCQRPFTFTNLNSQ